MLFLTYLILSLGIVAFSSGSDEKHLPVNTHDLVAIFRELAETIDGHRTLSNSFPEIALAEEDYLSKLFKKSLLSESSSYADNITECAVAMKDFVFDVARKKSYSLKMLDSWGKFGSGFATGNMKWLGRYYECLDAKTNNFSGRYFVVFFGPDPTKAAELGICLPDACSEQEVNEMIYPFSGILKTKVYAYQPVQPTEYSSVDIGALITTCIFGCLLIVATAYEIYLKSWYAKYDPLTAENAENDVIVNLEPSVSSQLLLSFSAIKNTRALFDTTQKDGNINVLHGLRFISMTWVIIGHTFIFGAYYVDNVLDAANYYISSWQFQAIGNGTYSVDSFFFLSGLLAAYLGMREMNKRNGRLSIGLPYLYRYIRLTPAYAFCILITVSLFSKVGDGPMWPSVSQAFEKPCDKYWWTNLLYINNLYPVSMGEECFAWGWYLANDMQFFLLSPFILWALFKFPLIGGIVLSVGTGLSIMITGILSSHYHQQPTALTIGILFYNVTHLSSPGNETALLNGFADSNVTTPSPPNPGTSTADQFWSDIYSKPWCRMGVYFVGMGVGYILHKKKLKIRMGKLSALFGWIVSAGIALAIVYGLYGHTSVGTGLSNGAAAFYNAISRPAWAACLAWVVVACSSGYGGPVNSFLSWKVFIPLSRLTYCAYLVHPLVIYWAYGILEDLLHFSMVEITMRFLAILALSYAIAYLLSLLLEMPFLGIIRATLGKTMGKRNSSQNTDKQQGRVNYNEERQEDA